MRILLVKPGIALPSVRGLARFWQLEPLELGYLAAAAPGHEYRVLDLRLSSERSFVTMLRRFRPDLVGITAYSHEAAAMKRLARAAKRRCPQTRVVVGGHHATVAPEDCNAEGVDWIVRGEGCLAFRALVEAMSRGQSPSGIAGLLSAGASFDPVAANCWPDYPDPARLPIPRRDLWNWRDYHCVWAGENPRPWQVLFPPVAMMRTSYGCRMKCSFCIVPTLSGGEHRVRPIDAVVEELTQIAAEHVYFADDESFLDESYAMELADAIERAKIHKRYFAWSRSTTILRSPEVIRRWRRIGLDAIFVGFESGSDEGLRAMKKGATVAANARAHALLRDLGVACHAAFMVHAEDGEEQFAQLRRCLEQMPPAQCSFTICTPSPGTADYEQARGRIWVDNPHALHDCMHPLTPTALPLRRFGELFGGLVRLAAKRNPLRLKHHPIRPWELIRAIRAEHLYARSLERMHRDFPRELWNWPGTTPAASRAEPPRIGTAQ